MSATRRGAVIFGILIVVLGACSFFTFSFLPSTGSSVALPVIVVPPEPYREGWPSANFNWTNTLTAMILADIMVLIFIGWAWRASKGWTKQVPSRFQAFAETVGGFMFNQSVGVAGNVNGRKLFPLVATIFVFLLAVNWMKLFPGIESVGIMHCAGHSSPEIGITITSGHPRIGDRLWVDQVLFPGYAADEDDYHACEEYKEGHVPKPSQEQLDAASEELSVEEEALVAELDAQIEAGTLTSQQKTDQVDTLRLEAAETVYEHASVALSADELEKGVVPYLYVVTPFVRGGSTDLNLTIGLALIVFVAIQVFGVIGQGPDYFQKFINLRALGNISKKPLGLVDFLVGLFEIVSEFGKIISLSFRLFGNMFAGGILLAVMSFLVAPLLPGLFIGLEVIVTTIQAYVFAVLTLVFSAQAMEGHHGDDDHDHAEEPAH